MRRLDLHNELPVVRPGFPLCCWTLIPARCVARQRHALAQMVLYLPTHEANAFPALVGLITGKSSVFRTLCPSNLQQLHAVYGVLAGTILQPHYTNKPLR